MNGPVLVTGRTTGGSFAQVLPDPAGVEQFQRLLDGVSLEPVEWTVTPVHTSDVRLAVESVTPSG